MDTRSIQENDLSLVAGVNGLDTVPCGLGLLGCDGDLLPDEMVHQGRLAHIRTPDNCYKSGFKIWCHENISSSFLTNGRSRQKVPFICCAVLSSLPAALSP